MATFTRQAIMKTFMTMLKTTPFDRITVSALVKKCGISSNTFYYHFKDIYDLLVQVFDEILVKFLPPSENAMTDWQEAGKAFLHACQDNPDIVYNLSDSLSRDNLEKYIFTTMDDFFYQYVRSKAGGLQTSEERLREIADFCLYLFCGYFLKFLWNRMAADVDLAVDRLSALYSDFVELALKK